MPASAERGFGCQLLEATGICTILVTVGPLLSANFFLYLIFTFGTAILVFGAVSRIAGNRFGRNIYWLGKDTQHSKLANINKHFLEDVSARLCMDINRKSSTNIPAIFLPHCSAGQSMLGHQSSKVRCKEMSGSKRKTRKISSTSSVLYSAKASLPNCVKKISRKLNCIASSRTFRVILGQSPRKQISKYYPHPKRSMQLYSGNEKINFGAGFKTKSFHLSLEGLHH